MFASKSIATIGALGLIIGQDSAISIGCAVAIIGFVWTVGRRAKGYEDKIDGIGPRLDRVELELRRVESELHRLKHERAFDLDMMRREMSTPIEVPDRSYSILIVDDNPTDRQLIRRSIRHWNVEEASTLKEAIEKLEENRYDCVVLDLGLPDAHRGQTITELMRVHPGAVCVAISGSDDPSLPVQAVAAGADSFMQKGGEGQYLAQMIMHAIRRKTLRREL